MRFDEVRQAIIQEWFDLPAESRQSEEQAANFATKAARNYSFDPEMDPFKVVMRWLNPYIAQGT